jgi:hypothetical protein
VPPSLDGDQGLACAYVVRGKRGSLDSLQLLEAPIMLINLKLYNARRGEVGHYYQNMKNWTYCIFMNNAPRWVP